MAFEDAAILCRCFEQASGQDHLQQQATEDDIANSTPSFLDSKPSVHEFVIGFENVRINRVRKIWEGEWAISEAAYKAKIDGTTTNGQQRNGDKKAGEGFDPMGPEFRRWLYDGV